MQNLKKTFNRFSLDQKVLTLIIIEVLGFCIVGFVAISQLRNVGGQVERIAEVTFPLHISVENIRTQILQQHITTSQITAGLSQRGFNETAYSIRKRLNQMNAENEIAVQKSIEFSEKYVRKVVLQQDQNENALSLNSEELLQGLFDLRRATQIQNQLIVSLSKITQNRGSGHYSDILQKFDASKLLVDQKLNDLSSKIEKIRIESIRHALYVKRIAIGFIVLTLLAAVVFFVGMLLLIVRRNISKPLQLLTDTINAFTAMLKVEESEFEKGLMERRDELGRMSRSFNRLKHDLWNQGQDLHEAIAEAEHANHAKSMFLAAASHDLRQPLHAMQMYIAALRQKVNDKDTLAVVDDIDAVSISTARLLSALLDVSQLEAGAIEPSIENFPINDVLNRVWREFAPFAKQKNLDFKMVPCKLHVRSDPVLLERILGNFMSNAIRYTESGGILLGVRRRSGLTSIEVWDTGRGIPNDQIQAIFEDFHQIDNEERDRSKGLGLGLAIAERLAICLSHEIACDSIVGKGSRFAVMVTPVAAKVSAPSIVEELDFLLHGLSGRRILLVEDDLEVLKATRRLLESWGCIVTLGTKLEEVMSLIQDQLSSPPELILADNRLPGGAEGVEVVQQVQQHFGYTIPSIIVTGDVQEEHLKEISSLGFRVLSKPVQPAKLRSLITQLLSENENSSISLKSISA